MHSKGYGCGLPYEQNLFIYIYNNSTQWVALLISGSRHIRRDYYSLRIKSCTLQLIIIFFCENRHIHQENRPICCIFIEKWVLISTLFQVLKLASKSFRTLSIRKICVLTSSMYLTRPISCIFIEKIYQRKNATSFFFSTNNNFDDVYPTFKLLELYGLN